MPNKKITAEKVHAILLKGDDGAPLGIVIRNRHWVFYAVDEMGDDDLLELFPSSATKDHA